MRQPGRNEPCPCGSGKKYKTCCLPRDAQNRHRGFKTIYRFEPGSYGDAGRYAPSLACLKRVATGEWQYHFVLVRPDSVHDEADPATAKAEHDISEAYRVKEAGGSDADLALDLRRRGYVSVENFNIVADGAFDA